MLFFCIAPSRLCVRFLSAVDKQVRNETGHYRLTACPAGRAWREFRTRGPLGTRLNEDAMSAAIRNLKAFEPSKNLTNLEKQAS